MKFGQLTDKEVKSISKILVEDGAKFEVGYDMTVEEKNAEHLKRFTTHPQHDFSSYFMAIEMTDADFAKLSPMAKEKLLDFGITDEYPDEADFYVKGEEPKEEKTNLRYPLILIFGIAVFVILAVSIVILGGSNGDAESSLRILIKSLPDLLKAL